LSRSAGAANLRQLNAQNFDVIIVVAPSITLWSTGRVELSSRLLSTGLNSWAPCSSETPLNSAGLHDS
jgi:hypothetical protein